MRLGDTYVQLAALLTATHSVKRTPLSLPLPPSLLPSPRRSDSIMKPSVCQEQVSRLCALAHTKTNGTKRSWEEKKKKKPTQLLFYVSLPTQTPGTWLSFHSPAALLDLWEVNRRALGAIKQLCTSLVLHGPYLTYLTQRDGRVEPPQEKNGPFLIRGCERCFMSFLV